MPYKVFIPKDLDEKYPELSIEHKRWIVQAHFAHLSEVARFNGPLNFKIPNLGTFKTHGNKKNCFHKKFRTRGRAIIERKTMHKIELTKEFLLF